LKPEWLTLKVTLLNQEYTGGYFAAGIIVHQQFNIKARSWIIKKKGETYELSEPLMPYNAIF